MGVSCAALCMTCRHHSLNLTPFNFIPQRSHHSLILPRSRFTDSATETRSNAWGWHNSNQSGCMTITHVKYVWNFFLLLLLLLKEVGNARLGEITVAIKLCANVRNQEQVTYINKLNFHGRLGLVHLVQYVNPHQPVV